MVKVIKIDPVTRISGFLEITTEVEANTVVNAKTSGLLFRGFEKMLRGRSPLDSVYFTERICGICSTSHAMASSLAIENALGISIDINDRFVRDLIHGFEFLQNHLRQFYFFTVPDYVKLPEIHPLSSQSYNDFRLPEALTRRIVQNYTANISYSRLAHEGLAVIGGKAPHNHGIFPGGVTFNADAYKLEKIKAIIKELKGFINNFMVEDANTISEYYPDYFEKGRSYLNFMSYGLFNYDGENADLSFVGPGVKINGTLSNLDPSNITENIRYSWYVKKITSDSPNRDEEEELEDKNKADAYSFIKAPRYKDLPMEVGPLARLMLTGEYTRGNSCMDRNLARALEAKKVVETLEKIADRIIIKKSGQRALELPGSMLGVGLTDTIRGALGHWVQTENSVIKNYAIITPSGWNFSPIDQNGRHGTAEKALIGTKLKDEDRAVELGRIVRSFDPCISCATH